LGNGIEKVGEIREGLFFRFGGMAAIGIIPLGPLLCVPSFRVVCRFVRDVKRI